MRDLSLVRYIYTNHSTSQQQLDENFSSCIIRSYICFLNLRLSCVAHADRYREFKYLFGTVLFVRETVDETRAQRRLGEARPRGPVGPGATADERARAQRVPATQTRDERSTLSLYQHVDVHFAPAQQVDQSIPRASRDKCGGCGEEMFTSDPAPTRHMAVRCLLSSSASLTHDINLNILNNCTGVVGTCG